MQGGPPAINKKEAQPVLKTEGGVKEKIPKGERGGWVRNAPKNKNWFEEKR